MSEEPELNERAKWYVLGLLPSNTEGSSVYSIYNFESPVKDYVPRRSEQLAVLDWLENLKIIKYEPTYKGIPRQKLYLGLGRDTPTYTVEDFTVEVTDTSQLVSLQQKAAGKQSKFEQRQPVVLTYDPLTGNGSSNTQEFQLSGRNKLIFDALVAAPGMTLTRDQVFGLVGGRLKKLRGTDAVMTFNTHITNLRKSTLLSPTHLVQKAGRLTLNVKVTGSN